MNTVNFLAYLVKDSFAVASLLFIMKYIFNEKIKLKNIGFIVCCLLFAANSAVGIFILWNKTDSPDSLMDLISNILYIFAVIFSVEDSKGKIPKIILTVSVYIFTVDMFFSLYSQYLGGKLYLECLANTAMFAAVMPVLKYGIGRMKVNFLPKVFSEIPKWLYVVILFFDFTCYYKEFGTSNTWYGIFYIISNTAVILIILYLIVKIFYMAHQQSEILLQINDQKEYAESRMKNDTELRRFRHDYKNHMIVINAFLENGKTEDAKNYLMSMNNTFHGVINNYATGNFVTDAIMNNKAVVCGIKNIKLDFTGRIPSDGIENNDLCTVIANALDNAIEALEGFDGERIISVESTEKNGFLILSISNPVSENIKVKNNKIKTTKADKRSHGFGLKNIERIAEKYSGAMLITAENGLFTIDIRLKLKNTV